jgi:hypothetical protein
LLSSCKAASLGITTGESWASRTGLSRYCITNQAELSKLVHCTSIDFLCVYGCADCEQGTWDNVHLTQITDKEATYGYSLYLYNVTGIDSLKSFRQIEGGFTGGCYIRGVHGLKTLEGLEGVSSIGASNALNSVVIADNENLWDATGLNAAILDGHISVFGNPELVCVPEEWPETDDEGRLIRSDQVCRYDQPSHQPPAAMLGLTEDSEDKDSVETTQSLLTVRSNKEELSVSAPPRLWGYAAGAGVCFVIIVLVCASRNRFSGRRVKKGMQMPAMNFPAGRTPGAGTVDPLAGMQMVPHELALGTPPHQNSPLPQQYYPTQQDYTSPPPRYPPPS